MIACTCTIILRTVSLLRLVCRAVYTNLYKAAETVRVRTVLEFELHHPTCIGCAVGFSISSVVSTISGLTYGLDMRESQSQEHMSPSEESPQVKPPRQ